MLENLSEREIFKIGVFARMCMTLSSLSHDPKFQVGAMVITRDFREICALGYNGSYKGGPNERESLETGKSGFIHAEENCLIHLCKPFELRKDLIMICRYKACPACARLVVNGGIRTFLYIDDYDYLGPGTEEIFQRAGVHYEMIPRMLLALSDAAP